MSKDFRHLDHSSSSLLRLNLTERQLCDLELIMNGGFSPLKGFLNKEDYEGVVNKMRLANGKLWPIPVILDVENTNNYTIRQKLMLCDEYGKPLAFFTIESIYEPNKQLEAEKIYGTIDITHFGVNQLFYNTRKYYLGGEIKRINNVERYDFVEYRYSPKQLKQVFKKLGWKKIIGFQTRNPLHKAHFTMIKTAAEKYKAKVLLHPSVGMTKEGDIDYITRTKCYIHFYKHYIKDFAFLSLLPLAMRMAGPREALLHAIIRKNYGCTHFIIGRDHAGPGKDQNGKPFYKPYDAQSLVQKYAQEIGIVPIFFNEMVYVQEKKAYLPEDKVKKNDTIMNISGTDFRKMIAENQPVPEWFSFPEIIREIRKNIARQKKNGLTIFFTGLPSSGKSTLASYLYFKLMEIQNKNISLLDGDMVRQNLSKGLGFSREDRDMNIARIGFVANEITKHNGIAICAAIAPYEEARQKNRSLIEKNGHYVEVYLATPANVCAQRDRKGLYSMSKRGKLKGFTGVDGDYEMPIKPEITINTEDKKPSKCVDIIIGYLQRNNLISLS